MKRLLIASLTVLATACASTFTAAAASVGGVQITEAEVDAAVDAGLAGSPGGDDPATRNQLSRDVLASLIRQQLLVRVAERGGLAASDAEIEEQLTEIRQNFGSEDEFLQQVEAAGLTLDELRQQLRVRVLQTNLMRALAPDPTEEAITQAYREQADRFREIQVRHILYAVSEDNDQAVRRRTNRTLEQLRAGAATFARLAADSDDPSSAEHAGTLADAQGNRPGWIPVGSLDQAFGQAAFEARRGQIVGPVRSTFGYHVIQLINKRTTPLAGVREQIADEIRASTGEQAMQEAVVEEALRANVLVNPRYGDWDPATQSIVPHESYVPAPRGSPTDTAPPATDQPFDLGG